jgi:hypothetical protein
MRSASQAANRSSLGLACAAWLAFGACAHSPAQPATAATAKNPAPSAQAAPAKPVDWLPAGAFSLVHLDVDQIRALLPGALLADRLQPELQELLERTRAVTVALVAAQDEALLSGVFVGDFDSRINPLLLAKPPRERQIDPTRELWLAGDDLWLHTAEGYWVSGERGVIAALFVPPAQRAQRLSAQAWTAAPSEPYLASAVLHVTPELRAALERQAERDDFAALVAQVGPALLELDDVRMTVSPEGDGLRLLCSFVFGSEQGAQSGALVLRGVLAVLGARLEADSALSRALDAAQIDVTGIDGTAPALRGGARLLRAQLALDGPQLAQLARALDALMSEKEPAPIAKSASPYEPPSAEVQAERERVARAEPAFAEIVDVVIAQAGNDIELHEGNDARTGKPGKPFLIARVAQARAPEQRAALAQALAKKGFQVVAVSRGFEGRPTELGVFKARDQAAVLIARGTGEDVTAGTSKQLATLVRTWHARSPVQLLVADDDYFAVELTAVPADPERYLKELFAQCPRANQDQARKQLLAVHVLDCFLE